MKKNLVILAVLLGAFCLSSSLALAAKSNSQGIPEISGTYDVPGHSNLKVRVFVHGPKLDFGRGSGVLPACVDGASNAVVGSAGWHLPSGKTWNYYVNQTTPSGLGKSFADIAALSFAEWAKTEVSNATTFKYIETTSISQAASDGKNILAWGTAPSNALAVTYIWYNRKTKLASETDTIMNTAFLWSWTPYSSNGCGVKDTYDAQNILTHELGHWVGLDDYYRSAYTNNTMYGYGATNEIKKDTLTAGDTAGVAAMY